jgi:hypothetical protein
VGVGGGIQRKFARRLFNGYAPEICTAVIQRIFNGYPTDSQRIGKQQASSSHDCVCEWSASGYICVGAWSASGSICVCAVTDIQRIFKRYPTDIQRISNGYSTDIQRCLVRHHQLSQLNPTHHHPPPDESRWIQRGAQVSGVDALQRRVA